MGIEKITPEWLKQQVDAGRDAKYIADYLGASKKEVTNLLLVYGLIEKPVKKQKHPPKLTFEDVRPGDIAFKAGVSYTVIERDEKQIIMKSYSKAVAKTKVTKKKWISEKWKARRSDTEVIKYKLDDLPDKKRILKEMEKDDNPNKTFGKSFERAMRGLAIW